MNKTLVHIDHVWIDQKIPALVIADEKYLERNLLEKVAIIYHSFAHSKENSIIWGYELAKFGFVSICVDMDRHGERTNVREKFPYQYFYNCMFCSALEIKVIIQYLIQNYKISNEVTVIGTSLGGMAALAAAVIDDRVKNIITIASSANFTELAKYKKKPTLARILSDNKYDMGEIINQTYQMSKSYDPFYNIEKIQNKNILMINGGLDTEIPMKVVRNFQEKLKKKSDSYNTKKDFVVFNNMGHIIQNEMIKKACDWIVQLQSN